jgi:hypothetical protein
VKGCRVGPFDLNSYQEKMARPKLSGQLCGYAAIQTRLTERNSDVISRETSWTKTDCDRDVSAPYELPVD